MAGPPNERSEPGAAPAAIPSDLYNFSFLGPERDMLIGDIRYSYHRFGKADGANTPLVLISGMAATQYGWSPRMLEELSKSREVVIFDNALAGMSVDTRAGERLLELSLPFMAQSTVDLIAALNLGAVPDLLGVSMGGMVAQWIAAHHGGAVGSVVAAATSYGHEAPQPKGGISAMLDYLGSDKSTYDATLVLPAGVKEPEKDPAFAHMLRHASSLHYAATHGFDSLPGAGYAARAGIIPAAPEALLVSSEVKRRQAEAVREHWQASSKFMLSNLAASRKRLLWIHGTTDAVFPFEAAVKAAQGTPDSWLVAVQGAGHAVFLPRPREFAVHVLRFLNATKAEDEKQRRALQAAHPPGCFMGCVTSLLKGQMYGLAFLGPAKQILVGDIRYSYHRFGKADGGRPPLVLVTGMACTQYTWPVHMLQELSKGREVVIFDNVLTGLSVDTKAGERELHLTIPFMAQSVVDLIAALKLGAASDLLGMSMGGMVAQWIAAHHGSAVGSVVAVCTSYGHGAPEPQGGIAAMLHHLGSHKAVTDMKLLLPGGEEDPGWQPLVREILSLQYAAIPELMGMAGSGYGVDEAIIPATPGALVVSAETKRRQAAAIQGYWAASEGLLSKLAASRKRMLWMHGTKDATFPFETAVKAAAAMPTAWLAEIKGAGHALFFPHTQAFTQQLLKFLDATEEQDVQHRKQLEAGALRSGGGGSLRH